MALIRASSQFGPFALDAEAYQLRHGANTIPLSPKAIDLLFLFTSRPGALVSKDEMLAELWPDVAVTDNALTQVVSELRQALDDDASAPKYVETVPRRGYRFIAAVSPKPEPVGEAGAKPRTGTHDASDLSALLSSGVLAALREAAAPAATSTTRAHPPQTSSLEAYRALTLGRLALESLDPAEVDAATAHFRRALDLEPDYALAHTGLAHARFWTFQSSRAEVNPDRTALAEAIAHARRAVELDPELAEGHAALAFILSAAERSREARLAGRIAVALEPANWRHQFRLAVAAWGRERLECLDAVRAQFPRLAYTHYLSAMVHVARGEVDKAAADLDAVLREAGGSGAARFPGQGLRWLRGMLHLTSGEAIAARESFDREIAAAREGLFGAEFARDAHEAIGLLCLDAGDLDQAAASFERARERYPDHPRSLIGLARAAQAQGEATRAEGYLAHADRAIAAMDVPGRESAVAMARAAWLSAAGRDLDAATVLDRLLEDAPPGPAGWMLPIDPALSRLRATSRGEHLLERLAQRAD
jgi:DNA-binding winged helix-turn-helix (wHTH) protein